jgi:tripartite-type tricarboxylate transporter receptor subunit TctC
MLRRLIFATAVSTYFHHASGAEAPGQHGVEYPAKSIRVVVPSSPGGGIDTLARILGPKISERWGKPVIVDNRPGAGGLIGYEIVAKAPPDGYTVLLVAGGYTLNPSLYSKIPYDAINDFERVSLAACAPNLLVVHSSLGVNSLKDLISLAKAKPNFLTYASSGVGTTSYLAAEVMKARTGTEMVHVPYKGAGLSNAAAIGGEVHFIFSAPHSMVPYVRIGRVRALAVTSARRLPLVPEVPTMAEAALPGFDVNSCYGVLLPARTPTAIVGKLNAEVVRILHAPEVRSQLELLSFDVIGSSAEEYTAFTKADLVRWNKELRLLGIKPE